MGVDTTTKPNLKNDRVNDTYFETCYHVSKLRSYSSKNPDKVSRSMFFRFKENFDYLFTITYTGKELISHDITSKIGEWLIGDYKNPNTNDVKNGIYYFSEYQKLLIMKNIINNDKVV